MNNIPEAKGKKPCEYFDVMAGTSTGGYVVITRHAAVSMTPHTPQPYCDHVGSFGDVH